MDLRIPMFLATAAVAAGLLGGCATDTTTPAAPAAGAPTGSPCVPASGPTVTVTEADNGRSLCLGISQRIEVFLQGTPEDMWQPIAAEGGALAPTASGKRALARGVTGAAFTATAAGAAQLSSQRPLCSSSPSGATSCAGRQAFRVMVTVG